MSLNQPIGSNEDGEFGDLFSDPLAVDPAEEAGSALQRESVRRAIRTLPEQERRVIELRFGMDGDPQSLEAIGREFGLSRERIRQLEGSAMDKLERELAGLAAQRAAEDELAQAA